MYCFVDVETTGFVPGKHEIITLAAVLADNKLNQIDERLFQMRPTSTWSKEAERVHGISYDEAYNYEHPRDVLASFYQYLSGFFPSFTFVCHARAARSRVNLFDYQHLLYASFYNDLRCEFYKAFPEEHVVSTMSRSRKEAFAKWNITSQKLDAWARKLNIVFDHHNALDDAKMCYKVFRYQQGADLC